MEVLFHFIFELIKISILGVIYATLIFVIILIIGKFKPNSWFERVSKKKSKLWFLSGGIISILLFAFMFTYWGNHGLGDWATIPIGNWKEVEQVDGTRALIQNTNYENGNTIAIDRFQITNDFLCGKIQNGFLKYPGNYFVYDLKTNNVIFFLNDNEYENYAGINNLPKIDEFNDFQYHYKEYWNGWRFWLLP